MLLLALIYFARCFGESHRDSRLIGCYLICSRIQLNSDQKEIVDFAKAGHNLFITGIYKNKKQIIRCFKASRKIVGVICSSGIACQVLDRGTASTVHSFYGLSTAELPWRQLVDRSLGNSLIRERVKAPEALDVIQFGMKPVCRVEKCLNL